MTRTTSAVAAPPETLEERYVAGIEPLVRLRDGLRALGIRRSDRQIIRWRLREGLPHYKIAGDVLARMSELRAWVAERQVNRPAAPVLDQRAADAILAAHGLPREQQQQPVTSRRRRAVRR